MSGRVQPAARAAWADVPLVVSLLSPASRVFATPVGMTCSHPCCCTGTAFPFRSVTERIGVGGHQTPPLISVAETFAISSGLTGLLPKVNDSRFRKYCDCGSSYCGFDDFGSGVAPASFVARVFRRPSL